MALLFDLTYRKTNEQLDNQMFVIYQKISA